MVPTYLPATRYGGPIFAVHGLCRSLRERGHDVDVLTTNVDGDSESGVPLQTPVPLEGVTLRYFPVTTLPFARRLYLSLAMRRWLRLHAQDYDLVHLHSVFLAPTAMAARAARQHNVPYVVSPRGMLVPELIDRKSGTIKRLWMSAVERRTFADAAAIHFTARQEWDDAIRTRIPLPAPFVVPNGTELPEVPTTSQRGGTILFLGRINWKKGIDLLIDAMALLPDFRLIVAGNDEESLLAGLRAQATRYGTLERIEFAGPVSGLAKQRLLETSAALVLPSHSENFGNVVLEAMAAATPVIVSPEVGLASEVTAAEAGLVVDRDPASLATAIRQLLRDPADAARMGRNGRAAVERRFTWERVAAEMEQHYAGLIAAFPRKR